MNGRRCDGTNTLPDALDISDYELIEDEKPYREWCVPAELIRREGKIRLMSKDEEYSLDLGRYEQIGDPPPAPDR